MPVDSGGASMLADDESECPARAAAFFYARRGWSVLPLHTPSSGRCSCSRGTTCGSSGKHPRTPRGYKDATTDENTIRRWWAAHPDANVGIATGSVSGIAVLDIDPRNGGDETLKHLEQEHGRLPDTALVQTGGGGRHFYFAIDGPVRSAKFRQGVELKAEGGYVVAPRSQHASGGVYRGAQALDEAVALEMLPSWLAHPTDNRSVRNGDPVPGDGLTFSDGERNVTLTKIAGSLRRRGLGNHVISGALHEINERACDLPLGSEEVTRIASSIAKRPSLGLMVEELNQKHAVVVEAGRTFVITEDHDPVLKRHVVRRSTFQDIQNLYLSTRVETLTPAGRPTTKGLGHVWLIDPRRRKYQGVVFSPNEDKPGYYNLWRGFAVEPKAGDWSLLKDHVQDVMCKGDDTLFAYVMAWMAHAVQCPGEPAEVALVLRGDQGVGKGLFVRELGALFGQHFVHVSHPRHLSGNFNAHLQDAVVVFADEAFLRGMYGIASPAPICADGSRTRSRSKPPPACLHLPRRLRSSGIPATAKPVAAGG